MMNLYELMDLKIDYAFKQLFGSPGNSRILMAFMNAMLKRTGEQSIISITLENIEFAEEHVGDKNSRLDLFATTNENVKINIEIQFTDKQDMVNRSLYYWSRIYKDQMRKGDSYRQLHPTIVINILNFNLLKKETEKFHTTFHLYEDEESFLLTNTIEVHFIEMRKLLLHWKQKKLNPRDDVLARWLLLLGTVDSKNHTAYEDIFRELEEISMHDDILREAFASWEALSRNDQARAEYEARLKYVLDEAAAEREYELRLQDNELRIQDAEAKGLAIGEARGEAIGKKKEIAESIRRYLEIRFSEEKAELLCEKLTMSQDIKELEMVQRKVFAATSLDELKQLIKQEK